MSMQSHIIPSGRGRARRRRSIASTAVFATTVMLGILALLGVGFSIVALIAMVVLGSILILTDPTPRDEPPVMLV
jgi:hypothetical protein